jgi:hypothetical protein
MKINMGAAVDVTYHVDIKDKNSKTRGKKERRKKGEETEEWVLWEYRQLSLYMILRDFALMQHANLYHF